jgi:thiamine biosynthesis lipoprotein ApbE
MELIVQAPRAGAAGECERRVLGEIERLRRILSTYDPASEIRRVMLGGAVESTELAEVLAAYSLWGGRTGGAVELNMAGVIDLWKGAVGRVPDEGELRRALDAPRAWNVDALGKGYVIDRAVAVAREVAPGGLLNIGGDIRAWGRTGWVIGIADPEWPAENALVRGTLVLRDAAVATSGGYARYITIGGGRYSHLIDPRTLRAVEEVRSTTVVAADCVTANALSTAACVLGAREGGRLAREYGSANWIFERRAGCAGSPLREAAAAVTAWPADFQVSLDLTLKMPRGSKVKRPYLAVWVEDANGKVVRTVTVWGKQEKYLREMTAWWQAVGGDPKLVRSVTRATREAGKYTITWDGKDDKGAALPKGNYTLVVEINREHGRHVGEKIKVACQDKKFSTVMKVTTESEESAVEYGPVMK